MEPSYRFVKGSGWVSSYEPEAPTQILTIGNYEIKLELRQPINGELFFSASTHENNALAYIATCLSNPDWTYRFNNKTPDQFTVLIPIWGPTYENLKGRYPLIVVNLKWLR